MHRLPFVKPSEAEWIELIRSEVGSRSIEDVLWWQSAEGWRIRAFYQPGDTPEGLPPVLSRPGGVPWEIRRTVHPTDAWPTGEPGVSVVVACGEVGSAFDDGLLISRRADTGRADVRLVPGVRHREVCNGLSPAGASAVLSVEFDPVRSLDPRECSVYRAEALESWDRLGRGTRWFYCDAVDLPQSPSPGPATALAYALASASAWISAGLEAGVEPRHLASGLLVALPTHRSYFATVAALRAARIGMARLFEAWSGSDAASSEVPVHGFVPRASMPADDGETNLVRATVQLAAAVAGGCDAIEIQAPRVSAEGRNERLYTQLHHLLREEGHLHEVADPSAGAWYVERLTQAIGEQAWNAFARVEARFDTLDPASRWTAIAAAVRESAPEARA